MDQEKQVPQTQGQEPLNVEDAAQAAPQAQTAPQEQAAPQAQTAPQEQAAPQAQAAAEKKKGALSKLRQKRKEKKQRRKQLRKDLRKQKKEAYRSKTLLGKAAHMLCSLVKFIFVALLIVTIVRVNYKEAGAVLKFAGAMIKNIMPGPQAEITQEDIYAMAPLDEQRGAPIDSSAPIGEGETWGIYIYMVGSDLEAKHTNQLSQTVKFLIKDEAMALHEKELNETNAQVKGMVDTILANKLPLPEVLYSKAVGTNMMQTASQEIDQSLNRMVGDLRAASDDIAEILAVTTLPESVKVVIQPGGAVSWGNNKINPNKTQRFLYDSNGLQMVYDGHISNMADPNTLVDFLTYCEEEYPADNTMVIFWNHGAGAFGYGVDSIFMNQLLSLQDMRWAFEQVYAPDEKNPPVDIIGFDACLMASMEVANTFHGIGSYMLGSEDVEPGDGWDYTAWLGSLAENPRMNAQQLGKAVVDSYVDFYSRKAVPSGVGTQLFSMMDLSYADDLYGAYSDFAKAALRESVKYSGTAASLGKAANSSIKFAGNNMDAYNTVDLGLFMQSIDGSLESYSSKVLDVLDDMVIYGRALNNVKDSTGMTVYYPATVSSATSLIYAAEYVNGICSDPNIQALYYYKVAGCLPEELQQHVSSLGQGELKPMNVKPLHDMEKAEFTLREDGNFVMPFDEDARSITQEYRYNLMQVQEDGTVLRLGYDDYLAVNAEGELVSEYDGKWARIDGKLLPTKVVSTDGSTLRYSASISYNGEPANLLMGYDLETEENTILGVQLISGHTDYDILADRATQELKPGDLIVPKYETYNMETGVGTSQSGDSITYSEDTRVEDEPLPNGSYMSYVTLVDARGDLYDMKLVSFEVRGGVIRDAKIVEGF